MLLDSEGEKLKLLRLDVISVVCQHPLSPVTSVINVWHFLIFNLMCFTHKTKQKNYNINLNVFWNIPSDVT